MTRREWEEELQKHLSVLPANETHKVLEYYDELYEDKSELGLNSTDIIKEFGNPIDVANKIIEENTLSKLEQPYLFDDSNKEVCAESGSIAQDASLNDDKRLDAAISNFIIWFFIILIGFIFFATSFALIFGGIAGLIMIFVTSVYGYVLYIKLGVYLTCIAIGIFMVFFTKYILRLCKRLIMKNKKHTKTKKSKRVNRKLNNENTK